MPIVRSYPIGEVWAQPLTDAQPNVPAAGEIALFGGNWARDLQAANGYPLSRHRASSRRDDHRILRTLLPPAAGTLPCPADELNDLVGIGERIQ